MFKILIVGLSMFVLLISGSAWALTYPVIDTGDPNERVCNPRSYTDLGNGIVRENFTRLEWQKTPKSDSNYTLDQARDYVGSLDIGGHTDWNIPSVRSLLSLVDASRYPFLLDPIFDRVGDTYWTDDFFTHYRSWIVQFSTGETLSADNEDQNYVRAVRGEPYSPSPDFVDNKNGTVSDVNTGLMWQKATQQPDDWHEAMQYCEGLVLGGYDDWRLPTKNELYSLVSFDWASDPVTTFPDTESVIYWSSTATPPIDIGEVWVVDFNLGGMACEDDHNNYYFRAVRSGACSASAAWCSDDNDCGEGQLCRNETCTPRCELIIRHKKIRSEKLSRPRKVVLHISGGDDFDPYGRFDLGPLTLRKIRFNSKKNTLKIVAIVPAGLEPGLIKIFVGDCYGGVEIK